MFVGLLFLLVFIGMTVTDTVFASAGSIDIIVTERAVGHIGTGCIIACIAHIVILGCSRLATLPAAGATRHYLHHTILSILNSLNDAFCLFCCPCLLCFVLRSARARIASRLSPRSRLSSCDVCAIMVIDSFARATNL